MRFGEEGEEMNTDVMFSSKEESWATPQRLFDKLNDEFHFTLDPCASKENHKCERYFTKEIDGISQDCGGETVFCNPPYCRKTGNWVKKAYDESKKTGTTVVMLLPCRPDVAWFHDFCLPFGEIRFIRGRLKFGNAKNSAPFPSMICIFRSKHGTQNRF